MSDEPDPARLEALKARIEAARAAREGAGRRRTDTHLSQAQAGWRMVIELITGLGIGFGIGYGLDSLFGTMPWLLILFTLLGFAAGIRVMMGTARELQGDNERAGDRPAQNGK